MSDFRRSPFAQIHGLPVDPEADARFDRYLKTLPKTPTRYSTPHKREHEAPPATSNADSAMIGRLLGMRDRGEMHTAVLRELTPSGHLWGTTPLCSPDCGCHLTGTYQPTGARR